MKATRTLDDTNFWNYVNQNESGCWLWTGATNKAGYGSFKFLGRMVGVHRLSYEHLTGAIPEGLEIDHLCRVRNCVNPEHLEAVTHGENLRRRYVATKSGERRPKARRSGNFTCGFTEHAYTPENIRRRWVGSHWAETCRTCERARATSKIACPLCGRLSSVGNLAEHQKTNICQSTRKGDPT